MLFALAGCGGADPSPSHDTGTADAGRDVLTDEAGIPDAADARDVSDTRPVDVEEPEPVGFADGRACTQDADCEGGVCLTGEAWPDGYCTTPGCEACPQSCFEADGQPYCGRSCSELMRCRDGYLCVSLPSTERKLCLGQLGEPDGAACEEDADCFSGTCRQDMPGGFCTLEGCATDSDCAPFSPRSRCARDVGEPRYCAQSCSSSQDCRAGYRCDEDAGGVCILPRVEDPAIRANTALDFTCELAEGSPRGVSYEVSPDAYSYLLVPFSIDGQSIIPYAIEQPDGTELDMQGDHAFMNVEYENGMGMAPTPIPATDRHIDHMTGGEHTYRAATSADRLCYYKVETTAPGSSLDLNIYLVGVSGVDAASAPDDAHMRFMLGRINEIFGQAGITLDRVHFYDVSEPDAQAYQFIRSDQDIDELMTRARVPGATLDDALSVDVFMVRSIVGSVLGISSGIPGPAGLHGTSTSGIVVEGEYYASSPGDVGQVIAHEIGHYLGLFHTTEQDRVTHDPLEDTAECLNTYGCAARKNLMYPFAAVAKALVSDQQAWVLRANPLSREDNAAACGGCGRHERCVDGAAGPSCECKGGFERQDDSCVAIDDCAAGATICDANAHCVDGPGYYDCQCNDGFTGNGMNCTDVDECLEGNDACDDLAACVNTSGGYQCECPAGYAGDGFSCTDVDECADGTASCAANARCINTPGAYECECEAGYVGDGTTVCDAFQPVTQQVAAGKSHTCALRWSGEAVCIGRDRGNLLAPPAGDTFVELAAGRSHTCGRRADGSVACWEEGAYAAALPAPPSSTFVKIAAGGSRTCGLRSDAQIECWAPSGPVSVPSGTFVDLAVSSVGVCGLDSAGAIACVGTPTLPPQDGVFNDVAMSNTAICGLRTDGRVVCTDSWSLNSSPLSPTSQTYGFIVGGSAGVCGVTSAGALDCWASNSVGSGYADPVGQLAVGVHHSCGINALGRAECGGLDTYGEASPPFGWP